MKIACAIMTHKDVLLTRDTEESVRFWMTNDVVVVVDKAGWNKFDYNGAIMGLHHGYHKGPYRNYTFAIKELFKKYPAHDWYVWMECDVLVAANWFKTELAKAEENNVWMLGCDYRKHNFNFPCLEEILNHGRIVNAHYLLGCCHFIHRNLLYKLDELNFFDGLLERTKDFKDGFFPGYERHAFEEECFPTVAVHLGGKVKGLSAWGNERWTNSLYMMRFNPEIRPDEVSPGVSLLHPVKDYSSPIRRHCRKFRRLCGL